MAFLLGVDLGTSGTKTVLFDESGTPISSSTVEYPMYQPHNGWAEQDPMDWWNATCQTIKACIERSGIAADQIKGLGISGQMHGLVMLDKQGKVLRPSIIWCDQRTGAECDLMNELVGKEALQSITANPAMTGFTAAKILWVRQHEPEIYERCAHILLPKDFVRYQLTGEFATEVSDASGMQLLDVAGRCWSDTVLSKLQIDKGLLASMHESVEITGKVSRSAAALTGLCEGTPVVGGAGDNSAAAIGTGVVEPGKAFTTIGTSAVVFAHSDTVRIDSKGRVHSFCSAVPGKWTVMSCTQAAGLSLKWLRDHFCTPEVEKAERLGVDPYVVMDDLAAKVAVGSEKLIFLPYLMGERSPHLDPDCRGVFFGLSAIHGRPNMIRSVMEGVAFSQLDCVNVFREMGVDIETMMACGGGGRSPLWRQMLSDVYECPVNILKADEGPALGVAILAGVATGVYDSVEQACKDIIHVGKTQYPDGSRHDEYMKYYKIYRSIYRNLHDDFAQLAAL